MFGARVQTDGVYLGEFAEIFMAYFIAIVGDGNLIHFDGLFPLVKDLGIGLRSDLLQRMTSFMGDHQCVGMRN